MASGEVGEASAVHGSLLPHWSHPEIKTPRKRKVTLKCIWKVFCTAASCAISMIKEIFKSHGWRGPRHESYEEKYERRQEKRENLRRRRNKTTCRLTDKRQSKEAKELLQRRREKVILRRRNLTMEGPGSKEVHLTPGTDMPLVPENRPGDLGERSAYLRSLPANQEFGDNCTSQLHTKSVQHSFTDTFAHGSLSSSLENMFMVKVYKTCKGTQTTDELSTVKKSSGQQTDCGTAVLDKEIIQLSNYLKEALHRELLLKQKMAILQELLAALLQAAEKSWKGQLNEDKLKCRLGALENQLQTCTQSHSKRSLKRILLEMEDQKQNYELKAKESLQKLLEEKLQVEGQLQNAQRALAVAEEDCALWKEHYNTLNEDWSQLTDKHIELENNLHVLENKLQWSDNQNFQLHQALQSSETERAQLYSRINNLQEDYKVTIECLSVVEGKLRSEERDKLQLEATIKHLHTSRSGLSSARTKQSKDPEGEIESSLDQLQKRTSQLAAKEKECRDLRCELEVLSDEYHSCLAKLQQCRDEISHPQSKKTQRWQDHWIPLLLVVMATAVVSYLLNFVP
ncbi:TRAF3-interacting JNK-activating modulator isoform X1 [Zootoca vivipara]|uniref:TRAF3-interacting JNK-activating modulator isoform X1 n=1 Tax=Zootoca vivipara TaxID=8524 RepID=UPI00293C0697|nr:TRAF3-interacting JNK-activating modulator isoform X1 [Zootoca vivipara]